MTEHTDRIVVVGGGAAARAFVDCVRQAGCDSELVLVTADDRLPYFRPYLTKELLRGEIDPSEIGLDDASWPARRDLVVRLGTAVTGLDLSNRTLAMAGEPLRFDRLVLATGSSAATLPVTGADRSVLSIRSVADSLRVVDEIGDGDPVLVIGSGFVGCEAATSIRMRGNEVTLVSTEASPQQERLSPVVGDLLRDWLSGFGVDVRGGRRVERIEHVGGTKIAHLDDGTTVAAAHVIAATGASANVGIAESAGLPVDGGVVVDSSMRTVVDGVFAIGDVARAHNESAGRLLRVEHWGDAETMGRIAGTVAAGGVATWTEVPGFWSSIAGRQLKYVAWGDGWDDVSVRPSAEGITVWYGRDGVTVGVLTHEHDDDLELGTDLIRSGSPFPPG